MSSIRNEKGSVLVFMTLMIVLLMIMVGMGLDTGHLAFTRTTGQGAVDAAALSAITALPEAQTKADAKIVQDRATAAYLAANNYTGSGDNPITGTNVTFVKYDFGSNKVTDYGVALGVANGVRVALEKDAGTAMKTPAVLTPLFNLFGAKASGTNNVSVSAVSVMTGRPSIPIAIWESECSGTSPRDVEIKMQKPGSENACWTTYLDKSSGAPDIKALFQASQDCQGLPFGEIDTGIKIYENKGGVNSVQDTAEAFFKAFPTRCWTIPVITGGHNCNDKDPTPIVDWARMCYQKSTGTGADATIHAQVTCKQTLHENPDLLCVSNRLVREHDKGM